MASPSTQRNGPRLRGSPCCARGASTHVLPEVVGRVADPMSGYLLVRRDKLVELPLKPRGYKILIEILGRSEIGKIVEVGYVFRERMANQSKITWRSYRDYLLHLGILRFWRFSTTWRIENH